MQLVFMGRNLQYIGLKKNHLNNELSKITSTNVFFSSHCECPIKFILSICLCSFCNMQLYVSEYPNISSNEPEQDTLPTSHSSRLILCICLPIQRYWKFSQNIIFETGGRWLREQTNFLIFVYQTYTFHHLKYSDSIEAILISYQTSMILK